MLSNHPNVLGGAGDTSQSGAPVVGGPSSSTDNALVRWDGATGQLVKNGIVTEANDTGTITGPVYSSTTTGVGSAFTNQPANDGVEVLSSSALDITQTATVIGTTFGGNVVVVETVTLTGTTPVATVKTDWGLILAVKLSASCAGTITFREASGDLAITTITTTNTSKGVTSVSAANQLAYNRTLSAVSDGATTKQIGFKGTDTSDAVIYDSKPLNGATAVNSNSSFRTVTEIYTGDVEAARTETVTTNGSWTITGGNLSLIATGTNQPITLTPSGTGAVTLSGSGATTTGLLSFPAATAAAGGIMFGTDTQIYRGAANVVRFDTPAGANINLSLQVAGTEYGGIVTSSTSMLIASHGGATITLSPGGTLALALDLSQNATFAGLIKIVGGANAALTSTTTWTSGAAASVGTLTNAPTAGNPTSWIKINDNGTTRYIPAW